MKMCADRKAVLVLETVVVMLLLFHSVHALIYSIQPPRMVLRGAVGENIEGFVDVANPNNVTLYAKITSRGDIADMIQLNETDFALNPGENKRINFTFATDVPGNYTGELVFRLSSGEKGTGAALASQVIIIAQEAEHPEEGSSAPVTGLYTLLPAIGAGTVLVVGGVAVFLMVMRRQLG